MNNILELVPLLLFFLTYKMYGMMEATGVLIVATLVAVLIQYIRERTVPKMALVSCILLTIFGGLTLYLDDELFIKLKPTLVNLLFATILLGGLLFKKSLIKPILGHAFALPDHAWRTLTFRWGLLFIFLAVVNEIVWRNFSTDFWVGFKVFGMFPISLVFLLFQIPFLKKHIIEEEVEDAQAMAEAKEVVERMLSQEQIRQDIAVQAEDAKK